MIKIVCLTVLLSVLQAARSFSPDFITKYVENSKMLYADNGYRVVQEKTFEISDLDKGNNKIAYALDPGEYFVQLVTEPCFKINVEVNQQDGIISEKPEMRSSIAVFDVPELSGKSAFTEIKLNGFNPDLCLNAKARLLVYKYISE